MGTRTFGRLAILAALAWIGCESTDTPHTHRGRTDADAGAVDPTPAIEGLAQASVRPVSMRRTADGRIRTASVAVSVPADVDPGSVAQADWFLDRYGAAFGIPPDWELVHIETVQGFGVAVSYAPLVQGLRIFGAQVRVHLRDGQVRYVSAILPASVPELEAARLDADDARARVGPGASGTPELGVYVPGLLHGWTTGSPRAAWRVRDEPEGDPIPVGARVAYVEGVDGRLLAETATVRTALGPILDWTHRNAEGNIPPIFDDDCAPTGEPVTADAQAVLEVTQRVRDFYRDRFGLQGFRRAVTTVVGIPSDVLGGGAKFTPHPPMMGVNPGYVAADLLMHEYTHAWTFETVGWEYASETGAVDENVADVMAWAFDGNPTIGESSAEGTFRDLSATSALGCSVSYPRDGSLTECSDGELTGVCIDVEREGCSRTPETGLCPGSSNIRCCLTGVAHPSNCPTHADQLYSGSLDNGGVHINAYILNRASYLLAEGGSAGGVEVMGIGIDRVAELYFWTVTKYLQSTSGFEDLRDGLVQVVRDMGMELGYGEPECAAVMNAFSAVGIGDPDQDADCFDDAEDTCPEFYNPDQSEDDCTCMLESRPCADVTECEGLNMPSDECAQPECAPVLTGSAATEQRCCLRPPDIGCSSDADCCGGATCTDRRQCTCVPVGGQCVSARDCCGASLCERPEGEPTGTCT